MKSPYSSSNPLSKSSALSPWTERGCPGAPPWDVGENLLGCGPPLGASVETPPLPALGLPPWLQEAGPLSLPPSSEPSSCPCPGGPSSGDPAPVSHSNRITVCSLFFQGGGHADSQSRTFPQLSPTSSSPIAKQRPIVWEEVISTTFRLSHETPGHLPPAFPFSFFSWLGWKCDGGSYSSSFTP